MYIIYITNNKNECIDIICLSFCSREGAFEILNNTQNTNERNGKYWKYELIDYEQNTVFKSFM